MFGVYEIRWAAAISLQHSNVIYKRSRGKAYKSCCVYTTKIFEKFVRMDGLFEANRLVEVSMTKLGCLHKGGELPLRKTLMISKVLNKAQNIATSAHYTFLQTCSQTPTRSSSSKLLASISKKVETSSSSCFEDDPLPVPVSAPVTKPLNRELSPIVSCSNVSKLDNGEEAMDFESVNSVLSNILSDCDTPSSGETNSLVRVSSNENLNKPRSTARPSKFLADLSNTEGSTSSGWNAWRLDAEVNSTWCWPSAGETRSTTPEDVAVTPPSPGKRHHKAAFPAADDDEKENALQDGLLYDETKRFKPSPPEGCPLESLPGFCGYLSPKNLQSAPLITYMFGRGFTEPSNPSSSDWPSSFNPVSTTEPKECAVKREVSTYTENHFVPPFQTSAMKFSPILAF